MIFAITADLHANWQAWNAVLTDARSSGAGRILVLGDMVGYGPSPRRVLESVYNHADHITLGNHDAALAGLMDPSGFNDTARTILDWTAGQVADDGLRFLRDLPLSLDAGLFRCTHGEFSAPGEFQYIFDIQDALPSWVATEAPLLFVGHTHRPAIFIRDNQGNTHQLPPSDFSMEKGRRYLVCLGSVGNPRDGDIRSSYCLFDESARSVFWRRVPFDIDGYESDLKASGIPPEGSRFLRHDPRTGVPLLRPQLSFSPKTSNTAIPSVAREVETIDRWKRQSRTWRRAFTIASILLITLAAVGARLAKGQTESIRLESAMTIPVLLPSQPSERNLIPSINRYGQTNQPVAGYAIELASGRLQSVSTHPDTGWRLTSSRMDLPVRISTAPVYTAPGVRFRMQAQVSTPEPFKGNVALVVSAEVAPPGGERRIIDQYQVREVNPRPGQDIYDIRRTFSLPAHCQSIHCSIRGNFSGTLHVSNWSLVRTR